MKNNNKNIERYKKIIVDIVKKYLPDCIIYLFGSRARQDNREGADIDIALFAGDVAISFNTLLMIRSDLEESSLPVFVDVVDLNRAPDSLKKEVDRDGIKWE